GRGPAALGPRGARPSGPPFVGTGDQLFVAAAEPMRTIGPCGFGTPPAFSTVTAAAWIAPALAGTVATTRPSPRSSGWKRPACTGPSFSVIHHSSYVLSAGTGGRSKA